ncbi:hypothetical protein N7456_009267 [Penicillium angulare]|uniref:F-box domain-containing protein n=1 Tax=Penicillium angulare TaxID=116970 RepID=A0A9W9K5K2_9EURO|nr:hypothetical protein N7456_009267 [Penicillium angulare]
MPSLLIEGDSIACPSLPPEVWSMIIQWLLVDHSPRQLHKLAQVSHTLNELINQILYKSVALRSEHETPLFTRTLQERPELGTIIREFRHDDDTGCKINSPESLNLYKQLEKLRNVESLVMRKRESAYKLPKPSSASDRELDHRRRRDLGLGHDALMSRWTTFSNTLWFKSLEPTSPGLPALRSCHIGDDNLSEIGSCVLEELFWLPSLERLCITNGSVAVPPPDPSDEDQSYPEAPPRSTALKELLLLNTLIDAPALKSLMRYPKALKKFTYRGVMPNTRWHLEDYMDALENHHSSLESMDIDFYKAFPNWPSLDRLIGLKHLTSTPSALTGNLVTVPLEDVQFPPNLGTLTIRYEKALTPNASALPFMPIMTQLDGQKLDSLKSFTIEVPQPLDMRKGASVKIPFIDQVVTHKRLFKERGVELRVPTVPYPKKMPRYETCPCERLDYYHFLPKRMRRHREELLQADSDSEEIDPDEDELDDDDFFEGGFDGGDFDEGDSDEDDEDDEDDEEEDGQEI